MKIEYRKEPIDHLIIRDLYSKDELEKIFKELDFLTQKTKLVHSDHSYTNQEIKNNYLINLNDTYKDENFSDIITISKKILNKDIIESASEFCDSFYFLKMINSIRNFVTYYENENYYDFHRDFSTITSLTYFFKEPKKFKGGNFYLCDDNYKIEIENNMAIIYLGCTLHKGEKVLLDDDIQFSGNGKYCLAQFMYITPQQDSNLNMLKSMSTMFGNTI